MKVEPREFIERRFLAAFTLEDAGPSLDDLRRLPLEAFSDPACRKAWSEMRELSTCRLELLTPQTMRLLGAVDAGLGLHWRRDGGRIFGEWLTEVGLDKADRVVAALPRALGTESRRLLLERLNATAIFADKPPPEVKPRLLLAGKEVATPGNLVSIVAKAKSGKTAGVGAIISAVVAGAKGNTAADTLGFTSPDPAGAVVVFDTEQCPADAHGCLARVLKRANVREQPDWLRIYAVAGWQAGEMRAAIRPALDDAKRAQGGIHTMVLDGVADFVADVNDPRESNGFVQELHAIALEFACVVICVIHSNEGQKAGDDGRGHLGKQLCRKSESNLLFKKVGEVTTITSEKQRRAPITLQDGVAFRWSDEDGRHVTCAAPMKEADAKKKAALADLAEEAFGEIRQLRRTELITRLGDLTDRKGNTLDRRIEAMLNLGVIRKCGYGIYERVV